MAEHFLETDDIESSQKWLQKTKDLVSPKNIDTTTVFIHSLQSELFYYMGLFQFGTYEAKKGIEKATQLKDSTLMADSYFFLGINQMEINAFDEAHLSLWQSRKFSPKRFEKKHIRSCIQSEHIYNNIAQLKFKVRELDSAFWYNKKAYQMALKNNSKRGVPNAEQTFGQIYNAKNQKDSAVYYFKKSIQSAENSVYFDIALLNYAYLMECYATNPELGNQWFDKGTNLIKKRIVNMAFQRYFYTIALSVFKTNNQVEKAAYVQDKIIAIDDETRLKGNFFIQDITAQYAKNENKLLNLQIDELTQERKYTFLQLIAALLGILLSILFIIIIRRKNKVQQTLLNQKNDISKDLHDDIGSGLSSILIHADLLLKDKNAEEKQKVLATKIAQTGKEISQQLNTFIWSLSTDNNALQSFAEYVKQYGMGLLESTDIEFEFTTNIASKETMMIGGAQRKHLFLCVKELLNNAVKHANAIKISVSIKAPDKNSLEIIVADNGQGMNKENQFGNGITNVKKRIELLEGKVNFSHHNGLQVTIQIPLK
ncbi:ATP-binding protein [Flavobacterium buctense]|uniref:histidine kinase n=1 Tax=Flavobacterium buctense TaxID=1648146 RepID=A0ABU9DXV0_9FLAO|nr:ATP-binding protein [Flavobacterium buctense]